MHRLRLPVVVVLLLAFIVPIQVVRPTLASAAATCTPNNTDWSNGASGEPQRCINGFDFTTRRRLLDACLGPLSTAVYTRTECSNNGGVEAIAQTRAIRYLSNHLEGSDPQNATGISPNIQWEMTLPGLRPDIVVYDRNNASAGVDVIEAKVTENPTYSQWSTQISNYIQYFTSLGMANVRAGSILNKWGTYTDEFQVWDADKTCNLPDGTRGTSGARMWQRHPSRDC